MAIRVLSIISIFLITLLSGLILKNIRNSLVESIIINLITGCFVSIVIAYIEYRDQLDENIKYFLKEVHTYYNSLLELEKYIATSKEKDDNLLKIINSKLSLITENAKEKQENINFYFLLPSSDNLHFQNIINDL